ncbi:TlpA family protein disulfide reductase [Clostridium sp. SHJSY1]|uniref:TlpA family protein disulfide reductase n=1 Tax=Clostridium sp. SHJSY1 TaxID=2942483 RepID=UPI0028749E92|nr:TlpA disulfide reductase family protein [Clostridium sp. SHJSY1]MDS0528034.1 TlpA family protein disulfide reductase [Clostridium sp. SHJSY1]
MYFKLKKTILIMIIGIFSLSLLVGCKKVTTVSSDANMDTTDVAERGLKISIPKEAVDKGIVVENPNEDFNEHLVQDIYFYYKPITDKLFDDMQNAPADQKTKEKQEEFIKQVWAHSKCLMHIVLIKKDEYQNGIDSGKSLDKMIKVEVPDDNLDAQFMPEYNNTEKLGENGDYIYLVSIPTCKLDGMSEEEKKLYEECRSRMEDVKKNIKFIDLKLEEKKELPTKIPSFSANDLEGNEVTEDIFKQKDITMVNVWGTFCAPCIEEMPDLGEMARSMPKNVQMVGYIIDIDGDKNLKAAKDIVSKAKANFTQLVANKDMSDFTECFVGVPATFFVDKEGNILGEPIVGGKIDEYKSTLKEYLK